VHLTHVEFDNGNGSIWLTHRVPMTPGELQKVERLLAAIERAVAVEEPVAAPPRPATAGQDDNNKE
jgi:hypothetical protein